MNARARRAQWLARFDMEALVSAMLLYGTVLSLGLICAGVVVQWIHPGVETFEILQGSNVFHFLLAHVSNWSLPEKRPSQLIHLGVAVLLFVPYVRVLVSVFYFACIERTRTPAILSSLVLIVLTYVLFLG